LEEAGVWDVILAMAGPAGPVHSSLFTEKCKIQGILRGIKVGFLKPAFLWPFAHLVYLGKLHTSLRKGMWEREDG
jgi:hypothetical protein